MAKAVYVAGGQSSLAKKVGVTQGAVWKWVRGIKKVSPVHAVAVSNAVNGVVKPHDRVFPDIVHCWCAWGWFYWFMAKRLYAL
ncbi:transcriptional regulator [Enterobacter kobei]|uniref:transcriptional regulator n=1 Tax=Enterobacter kobei TaxID=208224 RepID=UPI003899F6C9